MMSSRLALTIGCLLLIASCLHAQPTPVNLNNPTNATPGSLGLSWSQNQDPNFARYELRRSTTPGVTLGSTLAATIPNQGMTAFTDTGLTPMTTYYYKVFVFNQMQQSAGSNEVQGTTLGGGGGGPTPVALNAPTNVGQTQLDLSWSQNQDPNFARYELHRSTTPGVTLGSTLVATIPNQGMTTFTDTGLAAGTTYYYRVFVFNQMQQSAGSDEVQGTTLGGGGGGPTAVTLNNPTNVTETTADLSWTQNQDPDFARYEVRRATAPGVTLASALAGTITQQTTVTHSDTGLTPGTTYYYKVFVVNTVDQSTGSNEVSAKTAGTAPPSLEATNVTDAAVTLVWTETGQADFGKYEIHKSLTQGFTPGPGTLVGQVAQPVNTVFRLQPLQPDTDYYFRLLVYDTAQQVVEQSDEAHAKTLTTAALFDDPPAGTRFFLSRTVYNAAGMVTAE
ncbi:MAG: hypothetical protein COY42_18410, partial [Armatimonadetes bacterium CG_4_10_14_0_8_um_filter_66_14]